MNRNELPPAWALFDRVRGLTKGKQVHANDGWHTALSGLSELDEALRKLASSKKPAYRTVAGKVVPSPFVTQLHLGERLAGDVIFWKDSKIQLAPTAEALRDQIFEHGMIWQKPAPSEIENANLWFEALRQRLRTPKAKKRQRHRKNDIRKKLRRLYKYLDAIFDLISKVLVCRVDFGYELARRPGVTVEQTRSDRARFLVLLKQRYPDLVGYCMRMEFGSVKHLHHHCYFFFNGHTHCNDIAISRAIGEIWREVTEGGTYFNCNLQKEKFEKIGRLGIGEIHFADVQKRANLYRSIGYLVKVDWLIRMVGQDGEPIGKTFIKGQAPKALEGARRGRPREQSSEVWNWELELTKRVDLAYSPRFKRSITLSNTLDSKDWSFSQEEPSCGDHWPPSESRWPVKYASRQIVWQAGVPCRPWRSVMRAATAPAISFLAPKASPASSQ